MSVSSMIMIMNVSMQSWRQENNIKKLQDILKQEDNYAEQARCAIQEAYIADVRCPVNVVISIIIKMSSMPFLMRICILNSYTCFRL